MLVFWHWNWAALATHFSRSVDISGVMVEGSTVFGNMEIAQSYIM